MIKLQMAVNVIAKSNSQSMHFIRVQNYELDEISKVYSEYYNVLMYRIIKSMSGLIMRTVSESGAGLSDSLRIMYGEYMGSAAVIYVSDAA